MAGDRDEIRALLAIPRPRTRGDCLAEARPCPWVGCSHHLLLEVATGRRAGLVLVEPQGRPGRRKHLATSATDAEVERWTDAAVESLAGRLWSCDLDAADAGLAVGEVAQALGTHHAENASRAVRLARIRARNRMRSNREE